MVFFMAREAPGKFFPSPRGCAAQSPKLDPNPSTRRGGNALSLIAKDELLRIVECLPWDAFGSGNVKAASREKGIMSTLGISFGRVANDDE